MGEIKPDKGLRDGSCNRTACQRSLAGAPERCSMADHETHVEGKRLYYCSTCADLFDKADRGNPLGLRIRREPAHG